MYKLSKYIVCTDIEHGKTMVFVTSNGKMLLIDTEIYNILPKTENVSQDLLSNLLDNKILIPNEVNELEEIINENLNDLKNQKSLNLSLMHTAKCQLGCHYCGQRHSNTRYSSETINNVLIFLDDKLKNGNYENLSLAWFGGEPLMDIHLMESITPKLLSICKKYNISYNARLATNGVLLTKDNFHILKKLQVNQIHVTIDGTKETHNISRITKNGKGTFDQIVQNLKEIVLNEAYASLGVNITIRCNVDVNNYHTILPLYNYLKSLGIIQHVEFYIAPVHSWGNDISSCETDLEKINKLDTDIIIQKLKDGFVCSSLLPERKKNVCMAVNKDSFVIDPVGNMYSCSEIPLVPTYNHEDYIYSNIVNYSESNKMNTYYNWNNLILTKESKSPCHDCNILPICGGACPKLWDEGKVACPYYKNDIKRRLNLLYEILKVAQFSNS